MNSLAFILTAFYYALLILTFLLFLIYIYFSYVYQYWKKRNVEYLKPKFPFGNVKNIFGKVHVSERIEDLYNEIKGPYAGVYFLNNPVLFVKDPQLLKYILVKDSNSFRDRGIHSDINEDPVSGNLFRLGGPKWRILRNKLSPTFTSGKLKMMFPILIKCGKQLQEQLQGLADSGQAVDIWHVSSSYTTDVISSTMFGIETNSLQDSNNDVVNFVKGFSDTSVSTMKSILALFSICVPQIITLFKLRVVNVEVSEYLYDLVRKIINYRETNTIVRNDFMQLMIQLKNTGKVTDNETAGDTSVYNQKMAVEGLTLDEIVAQSFIYIVAGYETSAVTMTFCLYELALNSDIQKRVQENIDEILEKHEGKISYDSVKEMEYLDMAVRETLRKYPPLGFLNRVARVDYQIPNSNIVIDKGTQLIISVMGMHRDPNIYSDPMRFDPERFNSRRQGLIDPFTYLPFGDGPRHCIGTRMAKMQTAIGLAMLLRKYAVTTCPETPKNMSYAGGKLVITPVRGLKLLLSRRK